MLIHTANGPKTVDFNKILDKVSLFAQDLHSLVDPGLVSKKTIERLADGMTTKQIDELSAGIAGSLTNIHPDYSLLGARILMSRLHKELQVPYDFAQKESLENQENTQHKGLTFSAHLQKMFAHTVSGRKSTRIAPAVMDFVLRNEAALEEIIDYKGDFQGYSYSALTSWMRRGLEKMDGKTCETPSQMFLRVAVGLNVWQEKNELDMQEFAAFSGFVPEFKILKNMTDEERLERIKEYYELLSARKLSLSGPILMHAGSEKNQMASCFLEYCEDSLTEEDYPVTGKVGGIMKALTQLAKQSQGGAGTAVAFHQIRSSGSPIVSSNGTSNGILPFMKMFDATIGAVNQSGKRAGVCAIYLEPWHGDILEFLDAGNHFTIEEKRCKNLFFALWACDLFFERLTKDKAQAKWTLFDPAQVLQYLDRPLSDYFGQEFKEKYEYLESLGIGKTIPLMEIWSRVCTLFQTTGMPYILNKDEFNRKSNQKNLGPILSSNICTEIALVANNQETAVCVLSSVCASRFVQKEIDGSKKVDYEGIIKAARVATRNLNNIIDLQYYPTPETRNSCLTRRAIGLSIQGLADLFLQLNLNFTSQEAKEVNKRVYECLYYGSLLESMELAKIEGPYTGFEGSPAQQGILQYDMWGLEEKDLFLGEKWLQLKENIQKYGLRNSEVTALAPTVSSAIRMDNNDGFEPFTRNVFIRQSVAGSTQVINKYLVEDLLELNLWNQDLCQKIIYKEGSVQGIEEIPHHLQEKYQTVYELDWRQLTDMMAERSPFVSQSSSFNHYTSYQNANATTFTQKIIYAWKKGLKTLSYYMHTETATTAKKELGGISGQKAKPDSVVTFNQASLKIESQIGPKIEEKAEKIPEISYAEPKTMLTQKEVEEAEDLVCNMEEGCEFCST